MHNRFENDVVLVTGGAGGMGESHVRAYHSEGARVAVADLDESRGRSLALELGDRATFVGLDVTDPDSWTAAVETVTQAFGAISILVNNAGIITRASTIEDSDLDDWHRAFAVNSTGPFLGIRAVAPVMRAAGGGSIVNIISTMGNVGTPMFAAYTASKWAVRGLTRSAALELGRDGIRVNSIHPGVVSTPFIHAPAAGADSAIGDYYSPDAFAIPRLAQAHEVSHLLLFLTSREAAFATGSEYVLDGGLLLGPALSGSDENAASLEPSPA